jgi:peptidoglycan/xylan/chitin deacetylase (PgdA/CDA1 family)
MSTSARRSLARVGVRVFLLALGLGTLAATAVWHPYPILAAFGRRHPDVLFFVPTDARVVALTIDDGPSSHTGRILEVLQAHGATATFFVIGGRATEHPELLRRIVAGGHELGNHLYTDRASARLPDEEFRTELARTDTIIRRLSSPMWFRPGSGWFTTQMLESARGQGYRCVLGSVYPFDPVLPWRWHIERMVLHTVRPGAIMILHDGPKRGAVAAEVLGEILPRLAARGYKVVSVGELVSQSR